MLWYYWSAPQMYTQAILIMEICDLMKTWHFVCNKKNNSHKICHCNKNNSNSDVVPRNAFSLKLSCFTFFCIVAQFSLLTVTTYPRGSWINYRQLCQWTVLLPQWYLYSKPMNCLLVTSRVTCSLSETIIERKDKD